MPVASPAPIPSVQTHPAVDGIPAGLVVGLTIGLLLGIVVTVVRYLVLHRKLTAGVLCLTMLAVLLTGTLAVPAAAFVKGMTPSMLADTDYLQMARAAWTLTPQSRDIPDVPDQGGHLYILYRFNCEACVDAHDDIEKTLRREGVDPYWVSTRSPEGQAFLQAHRVGSVPSAVYVDKDDPDVFYVEKLYPNERFNESGLLDLIHRYKDQKA